MSAAVVATGDPTLEFLRKFDDPSAWDRVIRGVPIFVEHETKGPDGKPVKVDRERLRRIADNIARKQSARGVVIRVTDGHTKLIRTAEGRMTPSPQAEQPPLISYQCNARIGYFGPEQVPAILVDEYVLPGKGALRCQRPYRSPEFYGPTDEITAVALLATDPKLDMGMVTCSRPDVAAMYAAARHGDWIFYAMGDDMDPEPKSADATNGEPPPGTGDTPPSPGTSETPPAAPDAQAGYKQFEGYVSQHPVLKYLCMKYQAEATGANPAVPPGTTPPPPVAPEPGAEPPPAAGDKKEPPPGTGDDDQKAPPEKKEPDQMSRDTAALHYERIVKEADTKLAQVNARLAEIDRRERLATYDERLRKLQDIGYHFDRGEMLDYCKDLTAEQFGRHEALLVKTCSRDLAKLPELPVSPGTSPQHPDILTEQQKAVALHYHRANPDITWEEAIEATRGKAS